jgi:hypothetical protein
MLRGLRGRRCHECEVFPTRSRSRPDSVLSPAFFLPPAERRGSLPCAPVTLSELRGQRHLLYASGPERCVFVTLCFFVLSFSGPFLALTSSTGPRLLNQSLTFT